MRRNGIPALSLYDSYLLLSFWTSFWYSCIYVFWLLKMAYHASFYLNLKLHALEKKKVESLTLKRTTLLLLSHGSIKTKAKVGVWLWQRSALSKLSKRNPLQLQSKYQYWSYYRCCPVQAMCKILSVRCAEDQLLSGRSL